MILTKLSAFFVIGLEMLMTYSASGSRQLRPSMFGLPELYRTCTLWSIRACGAM